MTQSGRRKPGRKAAKLAAKVGRVAVARAVKVVAEARAAAVKLAEGAGEVRVAAKVRS